MSEIRLSRHSQAKGRNGYFAVDRVEITDLAGVDDARPLVVDFFSKRNDGNVGGARVEFTRDEFLLFASLCVAALDGKPAAPRSLDSRELATVLAALRFFQAKRGGFDRPEWLPHFDEVPPLTDEQIDELCESLNACA